MVEHCKGDRPQTTRKAGQKVSDESPSENENRSRVAGAEHHRGKSQISFRIPPLHPSMKEEIEERWMGIEPDDAEDLRGGMIGHPDAERFVHPEALFAKADRAHR